MTDKSLHERLVLAILKSALSPTAARLAEAAWHDDEILAQVAEGASPAMPKPKPAASGAKGLAYLQQISVQGFRGIGRRVTMALPAGNGLTVVLGRNGSGKSSLAEGLEFLVTGKSARWAGSKNKVWTDAWRNLHDAEPELAAIFSTDPRGPVALRRSWTSADLNSHSLTVTNAADLDELGWTSALSSNRPFLPYAELESWAEKSTEIFDTINAALGLEEFDTAASRLDALRKQLMAIKKAAGDAKKRLQASLPDAESDPRVAELTTLLKKRAPDLDAVEALLNQPVEEAGPTAQLRKLTQVRPPEAQAVAGAAKALRDAVDAVANASDSAAATFHDHAELLRHAMKFHGKHGDADCPICGEGTIDPEWRAQAEARAADMEQRAARVASAHSALKRARGTGEALLRWRLDVSDVPPQLEEACAQLRVAADAWTAPVEGPVALAHQLETAHAALDAAAQLVREAATAELAALQSAWRPIVAPLGAWLEAARHAAASAEALSATNDARTFVREVAAQLRAERFAPIADQARQLWTQLRAGSSVDIVDIAMTGTGTQRKVELQIQVDQMDAPALGVMSQGELNALALSLFLPRACMDQSPFGFVVIDDPVQSMDPARVDGLARVLETTAKSRQVIVFTHDDRLTEALRRLQIPATVLWVDRREGSEIHVEQRSDPVTLFIQDAEAIAYKAAEIGDAVMLRVVPGLCRMALEAAICSAYRRNQLAAGAAHDVVETQLSDANKLRQKAALLLLGDPARDVAQTINNRFPKPLANAFFAADRGAHTGTLNAEPLRFVRDCHELARKLEAHT